MSHLRPLLGGVDSSSPSNSNTSNGEADSSRQSVSGKSSQIFCARLFTTVTSSQTSVKSGKELYFSGLFAAVQPSISTLV